MGGETCRRNGRENFTKVLPLAEWSCAVLEAAMTDTAATDIALSALEALSASQVMNKIN